ncbi:MAG: endonuclease/exonuclease/phosphatase family protein [Saprospiraceae bacterium]|nr:endonuclease/exonuclease/phosphatase family protein [Saprospiraceae bacterium]
MKISCRRTYISLLIICTSIATSLAKVSHIEIEERDTILDGRKWGDIGAYELLKGTVYFVFDPDNSANLQITDIQLAPRNQNGWVEAYADLEILLPVDSEKSSTALVEVSNRGGKFTPSYFMQGQGRTLTFDDPSIYGDGLLLEQGITIIWIGWQFDVPVSDELLNFFSPVAKYPEGTPIIGLVRSDWVVDEVTNHLKLGHRSQTGYIPYEPDSDIHILTYRSGRDSVRHRVDRSTWEFGKKENGKLDKDARWIHSSKGFQPGYVYELVYHSIDPPVVGLGLAAIRDIITFAKYDDSCPFQVEYGMAAGVSQTGRFLRTFLHQNFNVDEEGRRAYDGMMIMTAGAGRGSFNHRFAQPSRDAHRYSAFFYPTDIFPFTGGSQFDEATGQDDGLLSNVSHPPKIFYINSGYEYYGRAASLIHTSVDGKRDWPLQDNARIYHLASGQHYVDQFPSDDAPMQTSYEGNPLNFKVNYRALLLCLTQWVESDLAPPASQYPRLANQELVKVDKVRYPKISNFERAKSPHIAYRVDYGLKWTQGIITKQPPTLGQPFSSLVPQVDVMGNELGGIRNIEILVPLATYVPYSLRKGMNGGNGELHDFRGIFIPFPLNQEVSGDTRRSIASLYPSKNDYMLKISRAVDVLIDNRFVLHRDRFALVEKASEWWNWMHRFEKSPSSGVPVMTFNIRYDNPNDGENQWRERKSHVVEIIQERNPEFLGLQEALQTQCEEVAKEIKRYKWIGVGREDGKTSGEYAPIFYDSKIWKLAAQGQFWLSEYPERPSKGWDAAHERLVTWGRFKGKKTNKVCFVFNTHFDHRGEQARIESARLLKNQVRQIAGNNDFIVMGDFNAAPPTDVYRVLTKFDQLHTLADTRLFSSTSPVGPRGTFSSFDIQEALPLEPIDYIFCSPDVKVNSFEVVEKSWDKKYASDHFAVFARIEL